MNREHYMDRLHRLQDRRGGFIYLASPYSHPSEDIRSERAYHINNIAGLLMQEGLYVYSPIWACHRIAVCQGLPTDHEYWAKMNDIFIRPSSAILIVRMEGWDQSKGIKFEIEEGRRLLKPIFTVDPNLQEFSELE